MPSAIRLCERAKMPTAICTVVRTMLTATLTQVLREAATERPWTGELLDESRAGIYTCGACNAELFVAGTKFDSTAYEFGVRHNF